MDASSSLGRLFACIGTSTSMPGLAGAGTGAVGFRTALVVAAPAPVDVMFTLSALGAGTSSRALPEGGPLTNLL